MKPILFYLISLFILVFSVMTVTGRKIFRSAMFLLLVLVGVAAIYFLMDYTFLAVVQLIIYAGGIVVLIIFSILLTHEVNAFLPPSDITRRAASAFLSFAGFLFTFYLLSNYAFPPGSQMPDANSNVPDAPDIKTIGMQLMSLDQFGYILPFEVISMLLLAALVGCIVVAMKSNLKS